MRRYACLLLLSLLRGAPLTAQQIATPIAMPQDRAKDSYRIYASLLPFGETANRSWPHELWLVADTTLTTVPENEPCFTDTNGSHDAVWLSLHPGINPHTAVQPPPQNQADFQEILADFDASCHNRVQLSEDAAFGKLHKPLRLLTSAEQQDYRTTKGLPSGAKYNGAPALYGFTAVYFNTHHTVALVYATHWCGNHCGQGMWMALGLRNGGWKPLHWNGTA